MPESEQAAFIKKILLLLLTAAAFALLSIFVHNPKLRTESEEFSDLGNSAEYCRSEAFMGTDCIWEQAKFPGDLPHDRIRRNLWIRIKLPSGWDIKYPDPAVFLSNSYPVQAYMSRRENSREYPPVLFYTYGKFLSDGTAEFPGFNRTKFVRLPKNSEFNYIYIRIYVFYMRTEIQNPLLLGNYSDLVLNEFVSEIDITVLCLFYFTQ